MIDPQDLAQFTALIATWRARCKKLGDEGKYWEAGRLSEAANDLQAVVSGTQARQISPGIVGPLLNQPSRPYQYPPVDTARIVD